MIKFVYFDVGGVVIRDFNKTDKWNQMKHDIGITKSNEKAFTKIWNEYERRLGIDYDVENLPILFSQKLGLVFPKNYSMLDDFASRFEQNKTIWQVITKIQQNCRIGLLTNMYPLMLSKIKEKDLLPHIKWDVIVDSSKVGYVKPYKEIYTIAQERTQVNKEHILFIDNLVENLTIPKKLGWKTFLYDSADFEKSSRELEEYFGRVI